MWQLSVRDQNRNWTELGTFAGSARQRGGCLSLSERDPTGSVFFRVYADPLLEKSDAEILTRLEY